MASIGRSRPLIPLAIALALSGVPAPARAAGADAARAEAPLIELEPDRRAGWSGEKFFAPLTGLFLGGSSYWYDPHEIRIETTPPDAALELFYVRTNMQRDYEQAEAPARLRLPPRIETSARDVISIRASAPGYRTASVELGVRSRQETLQLDLEPVANRLLGIEHRALAGSGLLQLATRERSTLRLQKTPQGFAVTLLETSLDPAAEAALADLESGILRGAQGHAIGADLLLLFESPAVAAAELELRVAQEPDPLRGVHELRITLAPTELQRAAASRAREALARLDADAISSCALAFDRSLRAALDPTQLARALSVYEAFGGRYVRAALRRLGELAPGAAVPLADGSRFRLDVPLEFEAAAGRAAEVVGLLSLLRDFVAELEVPEQRAAALRSLIAPGVPRAAFAAALSAARAAENDCHHTR